MFKSLRRALVGLAVIASATVAVPVATSVVTASSGRIDVTSWAPTSGGFAQFTMAFGPDTFKAQAGIETSTGGLMLVGYVGDMSNFATKVAVVRIKSTGAIDTSFDQDGLKIFERAASEPGAADFIQAAGGTNYFVGGWSGTNPARKSVMLKMEESGGLVNGWGSSGWIVASGDRRYEGSGTGRVGEKSFFVDSQQIVMWSENSAQTDLTIDRFDLSTGQLLVSGGGISNPATFQRSTLFTGSDKPETFVMTSTTKILVATRTGGSNDSSVLYKIDLGVTPQVLDTSYNGTGKLQTLVKSYHLEDFRFGINNLFATRLFLAGSSNSNPGPADSWVVRLNTDGTVDTATFGGAPWGGNATNPGYIEILTFDLSQGDFRVLSDYSLMFSGTGAGAQPEIRKYFYTAGTPTTSFGTQGVQTVAPACNVIVGGSLVPITGGSNFFLMGPKANKLGALKFVAPVTAPAASACTGTMGNISVSYSAPSYTGTQSQFLNIPAPTVSGSLDDPNDPTDNPLFTLTQGSLPSGVSLSPNSGAISGTPTASTNGSITLGITATYNFPNNAGTQTGTTTINLDIAAAQGGNPNQPAQCVAGAPTVTGSSPVLDTNFGSAGWKTVAAGAGVQFMFGKFVVPTSDSKYLLISGTNGSNMTAVDVRKVDSSGVVDTSYNNNTGRLVVNSQSASLEPRAFTVDSSGRIYVLAEQYGQPSVISVVRLTSTGALDTSYDTDGIATLASLPGNLTYPPSFAATSDGDVYVVTSNSGTSSNFVSKHSSSGALVAGFGNAGVLTTTSVYGRYVALMSDGSLLVGGTSQGQLKLAKFSSAGAADTSWATSGVSTFGNSAVSEVVQGLLVSGQNIFMTYRVNAPQQNALGVAKLGLDGAPVVGFGANGGVYSPLQAGYRGVSSAAVLADGTVFVVTEEFTQFGATTGFVRFSASGEFDGAFAASNTKVQHGTCDVSPVGIIDLGGGTILYLGSKVTNGSPATEVVIGKFTVGAITPGTPGGGFSGSGGGGGGGNQNPPVVFIPPAAPPASVTPPATSAPSDPLLPSLGNGAPVNPPAPGGAPSLINTNNQPNLVAPPGDSRVVIGGSAVEPTTDVIDSRGAQVPPERRSNQQINEIRQQANELVQNFTESLPEGTQSPIVVVPTPTGAVIRNLVTDSNGAPVDVPAESVVVVKAQDLVLIVGGQRATVNARGEFQIPAGSTVGVVGSGLDSEQYGEFVVMSTPTLIKNFKTSKSGTLQESGALPSAVRSGSHTLVVASGDTYVTLGIEVIAPKLPVTGSSSNTIVVLALFTLVFGVILDRSRRIGRRLV